MTERGSFVPVGGKKISYSCFYCRKDITQFCRIRCAVCENVDLCTDCFCVGVNLNGHENTHAYQISDNLDGNIFSSEWTANEELLLQEG